MKSWRSCAEWPEGIPGLAQRVSKDEHDTEGQARGVCRLLRRHGFGGQGEIFPLRVWVEPINEPETSATVE